MPAETDTSAHRTDTDVIIVGAGPVGLALALELGTRGIGCVVVERRDGMLRVPRMSGVSTRSMEYCRRWGVARDVKAAVWPDTHPLDFVYLTDLQGEEIARFKVPSYAERGELPHTPEGPVHCPQIYFDPILAARAQSLPSVEIRYETRLEAFEQDEDGVTADVVDTRTGARNALRAGYLVGCDGSSSIVREALGIELDGVGVLANSVNIFFRSPEFATVHDKGWAVFYRLIDDSGCWAELIAIDGVELWRLTVFHQNAVGLAPDDCLVKAVGASFAYEIIDVSPWERRDYVAKSYSRGRVFIAGDSAHQCSPTGGLGMHTGIIEAGNLGWKLAAVIEGWGGPSLLDSYGPECRPIAARNVELSTDSFERITAVPGAAGAREVLLDAASGVGRLTITEQARTQICYEGSPICVADGTPPPPARGHTFVPSARPGTRAPHAWIAPGKSTLDLFGEGFMLLCLSGDAADATGLRDAAAERGAPIAAIALDEPEILDLYERRLVLVRPDGHIAWRGDAPPADPVALIARVCGGAAA